MSRTGLRPENGAAERDRTFDARAFNPALYQLSYSSENDARLCFPSRGNDERPGRWYNSMAGAARVELAYGESKSPI